MSNSSLAALPSAFVSSFHSIAAASARPLVPARVVQASAARVHVVGPHGESLAIVPRALLGDGASWPVVGDWVALDVERGVVVAVVPRRTELVRQAAGRKVAAQIVAANVDVAFVVTSLDADFSVRRLERYLTVVRHGGAAPVLLLTKAGLAADVFAYVDAARAVAGGAPVHAIDVVLGIDADVPRVYLQPGVTAVLLGSSGVGKSTLINHLAGGERAATSAVRASDGKGRHTTTRRELFALEGGAAILDTPGMRELALFAGDDALDASFDDVVAVAAACRFRDCTHASEPGCAVRDAIACGDLDADRAASFLDLRYELDAQAARVDSRERRAEARVSARHLRDVMRRKYGR